LEVRVASSFGTSISPRRASSIRIAQSSCMHEYVGAALYLGKK
jgi:hypothetical protein